MVMKDRGADYFARRIGEQIAELEAALIAAKAVAEEAVTQVEELSKDRAVIVHCHDGFNRELEMKVHNWRKTLEEKCGP